MTILGAVKAAEPGSATAIPAPRCGEPVSLRGTIREQWRVITATDCDGHDIAAVRKDLSTEYQAR